MQERHILALEHCITTLVDMQSIVLNLRLTSKQIRGHTQLFETEHVFEFSEIARARR